MSDKIDRHTPVNELPELLRVDEVSAFLGISRWLTYELIRRGELPSVKLGRLLRIKRDALVTK